MADKVTWHKRRWVSAPKSPRIGLISKPASHRHSGSAAVECTTDSVSLQSSTNSALVDQPTRSCYLMNKYLTPPLQKTPDRCERQLHEYLVAIAPPVSPSGEPRVANYCWTHMSQRLWAQWWYKPRCTYHQSCCLNWCFASSSAESRSFPRGDIFPFSRCSSLVLDTDLWFLDLRLPTSLASSALLTFAYV